MSNLTVKGNASGTGTVILEAPNTNTNRTITLPDSTSTLATTAYVDTSVATAARMVSGTAVASTSGTAIDFTGIPSWAKRVTVMLSGVSFDANPGYVYMRLGTSSGIDTSVSYVYGQAGIATSTAAGAGSTSSVFPLVTALSTANDVIWGQIVLTKLTGNLWMASILTGNHYDFKITTVCGTKTLSGDLDRLRIFPSAAVNFDAGTINIMYEG